MSEQNSNSVEATQSSKTQVMEPDAFEYYRPFRQHLRLDYVRALVDARSGRPLTLEEVQFLVGYDIVDDQPVTENCLSCGKEFQPVSWIDITNPDFLNWIRNGSSIEQAFEDSQSLVFGSYYMNPEDPGDYGVFCGKPYFYNTTSKLYVFHNNSCLVAAKHAHPKHYWGISRHDLDSLLEENEQLTKEREQARIKRDNEIAAKQLAAKNFFSGKSTRCRK